MHNVSILCEIKASETTASCEVDNEGPIAAAGAGRSPTTYRNPGVRHLAVAHERLQMTSSSATHWPRI